MRSSGGARRDRGNGVSRSIWRGVRWFTLYIAALIAFVAIAAVSHSLFELSGVQAFFGAASRVGLQIVIVAAIVLVADLVALVIYAIRFGQPDESEDNVATRSPLNPFLSNVPLSVYSNVKVVGARSWFISWESLVDGSATTGERLAVLGILTLFIAFSSIFAGVGLWLAGDLPPAGILFLGFAGFWLGYNLWTAWREYREAKRKYLSPVQRAETTELTGSATKERG